MRSLRNVFYFTSAILLSLFTKEMACAQEPARPFPQHCSCGRQFILPSRSREFMDEDVRAFYAYWKTEYLVRAGEDADGKPLYRVSSAIEEAPITTRRYRKDKDTGCSSSQSWRGRILRRKKNLTDCGGSRGGIQASTCFACWS